LIFEQDFSIKTDNCPHPKSLSHGERDFEFLPFSPWEKGLGDEGVIQLLY
jgi:hypothetical protein